MAEGKGVTLTQALRLIGLAVSGFLAGKLAVSVPAAEIAYEAIW
jgi:hypothetical protein